jgi:hypothetical protein
VASNATLLTTYAASNNMAENVIGGNFSLVIIFNFLFMLVLLAA